MPLMLIYQFADGDVEYDTANGLAGANTLIGYWAVSWVKQQFGGAIGEALLVIVGLL